jgi:hypothetical protein
MNHAIQDLCPWMFVQGSNDRSDSGRKDQRDVWWKSEKSNGYAKRDDKEKDRDESIDESYIFFFVCHYLAFRKRSGQNGMT